MFRSKRWMLPPPVRGGMGRVSIRSDTWDSARLAMTAQFAEAPTEDAGERKAWRSIRHTAATRRLNRPAR